MLRRDRATRFASRRADGSGRSVVAAVVVAVVVVVVAVVVMVMVMDDGQTPQCPDVRELPLRTPLFALFA